MSPLMSQAWLTCSGVLATLTEGQQRKQRDVQDHQRDGAHRVRMNSDVAVVLFSSCKEFEHAGILAEQALHKRSG